MKYLNIILFQFLIFNCNSQELKSRLLFDIPNESYFENSQNLEKKQKVALSPYTFDVNEKGSIFIPNRSKSRIDIYDQFGTFENSIKFDQFEYLVVKIKVFRDLLYILTRDNGFYTIHTLSGKILYQNEKTEDFIESPNGNIYFLNYINGTYQIQDFAKKIPIPKPNNSSSTFYSNDSIFFSLRYKEPNPNAPFFLESRSLEKDSLLESRYYENICHGCFLAPQLLTENLVLASNMITGIDFLFDLNNNKLLQYKIDLPVDSYFSFLDKIDYSYNGLSHVYVHEEKKLYTLATNKEGVHVFISKIQLNQEKK